MDIGDFTSIKIFFCKTILVKKKNLVKKKIFGKKILVKKNFWLKKMLSKKIFLFYKIYKNFIKKLKKFFFQNIEFNLHFKKNIGSNKNNQH